MSKSFTDPRFKYPVMYAKDRVTGDVALIKASKFDPLFWEVVDGPKDKKEAGPKKEKSEPVVTVKAKVSFDGMSEDDIRALAKEKKIKSWHVKNIEKLKKELLILED